MNKQNNNFIRIWALAMLLVGFAFNVSAAVGDVFVVDNIKYTVTNSESNEAEVSGFDDVANAVANLVIPAVATDPTTSTAYTVVGVGLSAFQSNSTIETVQLPVSVEYLGQFAFATISTLTSINLDSVVTIAKKAVGECGNLEYIGESLAKCTTLGDYAFNKSLKKITSFVMPMMQSVGIGAIYESSSATASTGLISVDVPASVTSIGKIFLGRCHNLTSVQLNWTDLSTVSIASDNFFRDVVLDNITLYVPVNKKATYEGHALWGKFPSENIVEGVMPEIGTSFVVNNLKYMITGGNPLEVNVVGFDDLDAATASITIPATVINPSDANVYNVVSIGVDAFSCTSKDGKYTGDIRNQVLESVSLPSSVKTIGNYAFNSCRKLESINLSEVVTIGGSAFSVCDKMTTTGELTNATSLGNYAFNNCYGLSSLVIPSAVTIGDGAISATNSTYKAGGITKINIPSSVTSIGTIFLGRLWDLAQVQVNWTDSTDVSINATNFFRTIDLSAGGVTLYVPVGTKGMYEEHSLWGKIPDEKIIEGSIPDTATGLLSAEQQDVNVYPNPSQNGVITLGGEAGQRMNLEIYSISGAKVFERSVLSQEPIATDLNSGLYMVRVNNANAKKLIIK